MFATTRWSLVGRAADRDPTAARAALDELVSTYWFPLYAFLRKRGHDAADAEDLLQGFLVGLLVRDPWSELRPSGRFRSWLLTGLENHVRDVARRDGARKRGGDAKRLTLEGLAEGGAEDRVCQELQEEGDPRRAFERAWARTAVQRALEALREETLQREGGSDIPFESMVGLLMRAGDSPSIDALAREHGVRAGTLRVRVHRLRVRCRDLLLQEVAETCREPSEVSAELEHLLAQL